MTMHRKTTLLLFLAVAALSSAETASPPKLDFPVCVDKTVQVGKTPGPFGQGMARMAGEKDAFWPQGFNLNVRFLDGTTRQKAAAWKRFVAIDKLVNLSFTKVDSGKTHIRVSFKQDSHWSYVGNQAQHISSVEPTMNLGLKAGIILGDSNSEWDRVALHEICHAIGMIHEHSNPRGGIQWNVKKVRAYYLAIQGWSAEQTDSQVLYRYSISRLRATEVDPHSIMMYPIPPELTLDGFSVGWNDKLSPTDIWFLDQIYPNKGVPSLPKPPP